MAPDNVTSLILLLLRHVPSEEHLDGARELIRSVTDWQRLIHISLVHGVAPLIYSRISAWSDLPEEVREGFKKAYLHNVADTERSSFELREIVSSLKAAGAEAVPIKGVIGTEEVYGDLSLYPSSDIDIMVRARDVPATITVMKKMGYHPEPEITANYLDCYDELHFLKDGAKPVDVHFRLGKRRYFDMPEDFWWEDLRNQDFRGHRYQVLSYEKTILFAVIHLFQHGYSPLKFLVNISEMLNVYDGKVNWLKLKEDASQAGICKPLSLSLCFARDLLGTPIPKAISSVVENLSFKDRWIYKRIKGNLFKGNISLSAETFLLTILQYNAAEVVKRMLKWIFPSVKEVACRYNVPRKSGAVYIYYLLNPVLLLLKRKNK